MVSPALQRTHLCQENLCWTWVQWWWAALRQFNPFCAGVLPVLDLIRSWWEQGYRKVIFSAELSQLRTSSHGLCLETFSFPVKGGKLSSLPQALQGVESYVIPTTWAWTSATHPKEATYAASAGQDTSVVSTCREALFSLCYNPLYAMQICYFIGKGVLS